MKGRNKYFFSLIPSLDIAEKVIRAGGELKMKVETKEAVYMLHKVKQCRYFVFNLVPTSV
jgi:hypothetical protein